MDRILAALAAAARLWLRSPVAIVVDLLVGLIVVVFAIIGVLAVASSILKGLQ
jgi:hypothetical protein